MINSFVVEHYLYILKIGELVDLLGYTRHVKMDSYSFQYMVLNINDSSVYK